MSRDILPALRLAAPAPADADADAAPLLVAAAEAARLCGVSLATWHRMAAAGRTPAPVRLSRGCVRWRLAELREWVNAGAPRRKEWDARRGAR